MDIKQWDNERYGEYLTDIEIARKEIADMKLYPKEKIICDLYAIPSHNFQAYYAMIYAVEGRLEMVYAKPQIYTSRSSEPINMYRFRDCKKADTHSGAEGRVTVGINQLTADFSDFINDITESLPNKHILGENLIVIDGVFQAIRVFEEDEVLKEVVYNIADQIPLPKEKKNLVSKLNNLYLTVGEIIGHVISPDQKWILARMSEQ